MTELLIQRAAQNGDGICVNAAYLTGVLTSELTAFYAPPYVATLRDLHGRREGMRLAFKFAHHAAQGDLPGEELAPSVLKSPRRWRTVGTPGSAPPMPSRPGTTTSTRRFSALSRVSSTCWWPCPRWGKPAWGIASP